MHHGRPLPMNLDNSPAPSLRQNRLVSSLMPGAAFSRYFQRAWPRGATPEELEAGRVELVEIGFSHVVLTDGRIPEPVQLEIEGVLESVCGAAVAHDVGRGIRLYRLERGVSAP